MLWTALRLLLVAYVPGALLFRLPIAHREKRAALPADERAFWAITISVACSSVIALALAAAGRYSLGRLLICDAALSAGLLVLGRGRLAFAGTSPRPRWAAVIPLVLVAVGVIRFFPPSEYCPVKFFSPS